MRFGVAPMAPLDHLVCGDEGMCCGCGDGDLLMPVLALLSGLAERHCVGRASHRSFALVACELDRGLLISILWQVPRLHDYSRDRELLSLSARAPGGVHVLYIL